MKKRILILLIAILSILEMNAQCTYCFGGDATLTATGSGGSGSGYTFAWSNSATTPATTVTSGTYTVTVTDSNGCTNTSSFLVTENPMITAVCTAMDNSSCGTPNGEVTVTPSGGAGGFTYLWSNAATTQTITGLTMGTYTVTVTDSNNCTATCSAFVDDDVNAPTVTIICTPN